MRRRLWDFDTVVLNLEDRDITVTAVHLITLTETKICFRLFPEQVQVSVNSLREHIEGLAADRIRDLASFLDSFY